jgi:hypothetical protein
MKRATAILSILLFVGISQHTSAQNLSEKTEISIITCDPGNELYTTFGHSALRVRDPLSRIDKVYNYGTFNFETPNFYLKFTKGQLDYMLTVSYYKHFIVSYMKEKRAIREQVLNLTPEQIYDTYVFLENNALPENMYYRYDFFFDNCATRVKDVLKKTLKDDIVLPENKTADKKSFKELIRPYLKGKDWERFGIHLCLGQPANEIATAEESTFLPDHLEQVFDHTQIRINGSMMPIVKDKRVLFTPKEKLTAESGFFSPFLIFSLILLLTLILSFVEYKKERWFMLLDKTLFFVFGFLGIVILFVWFGTEHKAVVNNWNVLWAMPLWFVAAFMIKRKNNKAFLRIFMLVMTFILALSLIIDLSFYDIFDVAAIPVIVALGLRSGMFYLNRR